MQTNQARLRVHGQPSDPLRACVHDLRNLFAVVASAKSLLERPLDEPKRSMVLEALGRVACDGKVVTDALLSPEPEDHASGGEAASELQSLALIAKALEHQRLRIGWRVAEEPAWILMAPAEFRASVLELVTNAAAAGARRIELRAARRGCRYWLIVADDGAGFEPATRPLDSEAPAGLHGTGLRRLAAAVSSARGNVKIRSQPRRGSVIALILPIMRIVDCDPPSAQPSH